MGIISGGRCCGRNIIFDSTIGINNSSCDPICLTVSRALLLPVPPEGCEFALIDSKVGNSSAYIIMIWDGVEWTDLATVGAAATDYLYSEIVVEFHQGWTAIVNGITYDTDNTYNIDPTYYLDVTFVSPEGCQYVMDRIGFDPATTPNLVFTMESLNEIPFDPNDLAAWNAHLGSDFQYLLVNPNGVVQAGEFILYAPQSAVNIPPGACAGWQIFAVGDTNNIVESVGGSAFNGVISNNGSWYFNCNPITVGASAFAAPLGNASCSSIYLPLCTDLGGSSGDDGVFLNYTGLNITATFNSALQTNNGGNVDGDIQYLIDNNTITITWV